MIKELTTTILEESTAGHLGVTSEALSISVINKAWESVRLWHLSQGEHCHLMPKNL